MGWELSLHGVWDFYLDEDKIEIDEKLNIDFKDKIQIPGILQAQGFGNDIHEKTPWISGLHDKLWYEREEYKVESKDIHIPFLCQPPKHYLGKAWYQKEIEIPKDQVGNKFYFIMECVRWKTRVWIDETYIGSTTSLCTSHEYNLGELDAGVHKLLVCVDNSMQYPYRPDGHMVSDALGATWNGMVGQVIIKSLPIISIKNVQAYPSYDDLSKDNKGTDRQDNGKRVLVKVIVENHGLESKLVTIQGKATGENNDFLDENHKNLDNEIKGAKFCDISSSITKMIETGTTNHYLELFYPGDAPQWDEYDPNVHTIMVSIKYENVSQAAKTSFGFRHIEVKDNMFHVNNRPTYFRGTHMGGDFPLTGHPSTNAADWKRMFLICKEWGLNYVRFHSYCPPKAAFIAADSVGIYLQIECGMWNVFNDGCKMSDILWEETTRILELFGNHPSFVMLSPSNEPGGKWFNPLTEWVSRCKEIDSRRLYTAQSGWPYQVEPSSIYGTDYVYFHRSGYGIEPGGTIRNIKGWHGKDYYLSVENSAYPIISHELGQWCSYPDFDVIDKFTGYLQPGNFKAFKENARRNGVLEYNKEFAYASGKLKAEFYKEEIEANFRTPHLYGFELLDLHDYIGQGSALVGMLDPFWEEKGFISSAEFRRFCSETIPLLRIEKRVFVPSDTFDYPMEISHFGKDPIENASIFWRVKDEDGHIISETNLSMVTIPYGKNINIGNVVIDLSNYEVSKAYIIEIGIHNTSILNNWKFWVFEEEKDVSHKDKNNQSNDKLGNEIAKYELYKDANHNNQVYITHELNEALELLRQKKRVLFNPLPKHHRLDSPPLYTRTSFWNSQMGPTYIRGMGLLCQDKHPALRDFPTNTYQEWQWDEIIHGAYGLNLDMFPSNLRPIVQPIDDWNRNIKMGMILECKVWEGSLLIVTADITKDMTNRPAARRLKKSLLHYIASDEFNPSISIREETLMKSFFPRDVMKQYKVMVLDEFDSVIDGDPNTYYSEERFKFPFTIDMETEDEVHIKGLFYMPRQNTREHLGDVKGCMVEVYENCRWIEVYKGELKSSYAPKEIIFDKDIHTKKVRFTGLYGFSGSNISSWHSSKEGWYQKIGDYIETIGAIAELLYIPADIQKQCAMLTGNEDDWSEVRTVKSATKEIDD